MSERSAASRSSALATQDHVLVYRSLYGQLSETFVRDHVRSVRGFRVSVLANRVDPRGPKDGSDLTLAPAGGRLSRLVWKLGRSRAANNLLRSDRPDLIHAHFLLDGAEILPYARRHGIPLVVTAHGYDASLRDEEFAKFDQGRLLLARRDALIAHAARIVCVSDLIRDELIARGYPRDKLTVLPLGVDLSVVRRAPEASERRGILTVGRLVEKKGTRYLVEAYSRLPPALRDAHPLTIIGDGPLRADLEGQARSLGVAARFLGGQGRDVVLTRLMTSAVFCLPSVRASNGDSEGMPIAIMEALALEVPVVIFDDQPAAPLLRKAGGGAVARAADADSLAREIQGLLDSPARLPEIGAEGRRLCSEFFDLKANTESLENLYKQLISDDAKNSLNEAVSC